MITCKLCGKDFKSLSARHLKFSHGIDREQYYGTKTCRCGRELRFRGPAKGWAQHCSPRCSATDPKVIAKIPPRKPEAGRRISRSLRKFLTNPVNHVRRQKRRFKFKKVVVEGREFEVQGYEPFFLNDLTSFGLAVEDIRHPAPSVRYMFGKRWRTYHPDFYIPKFNTMVEIKSPWTITRNKKMNKAKWKWARLAGYTMLVLVYDSEGKRVAE